MAAAIAATEVSFISVGTPSAADGSVSMHAVDEVVRQIGTALRDKAAPQTIVMRSTVPPGTAEERVIPALEQASGKRLRRGVPLLQQPGVPAGGHQRAGLPCAAVHAAGGRTRATTPPVLRAVYAAIKAPLHMSRPIGSLNR